MTHEQQLREAIKTVVELMKGNGFVVDDSDIMDGNMYITLCKPLNDDEGPEYDGAGFVYEDRVVDGEYRNNNISSETNIVERWDTTGPR